MEGFWKLLRTSPDSGALVARVAAGAVMLPHGAQKLLGWFGGYGFAPTLQFFESKLGVPAPLTVLVIALEFFGALALISGLFARPVALGFLAIMAVAIVKGHLANGFFMNWTGQQKGEGFEYHLLMIGLATVVLLKGGGYLSIDGWLSSRASRTKAKEQIQ